MPPKGIKEKEEYFNSPSSVLHQRHGDSTVDRVLEDDSINNQIFLVIIDNPNLSVSPGHRLILKESLLPVGQGSPLLPLVF